MANRFAPSEKELAAMVKKYRGPVLEQLAAGVSQPKIAENLNVHRHFVWAVAITEGYVKTTTAKGASLRTNWTARLATAATA